ncbi:thiamine phosphate synthase [Rossellomorea marisflavi]|uniref:thiamine phosphate synthase n=1 Tax=Rossellomorea marisflavi TaxID=189381 RepID=UPI001EE1FC89|nr:thiamine phosphate synthase [Rossellomorea marisflavi]UKS66486.1 thiamine phosphate synthase [Rossellomorea marisflavi]
MEKRTSAIKEALKVYFIMGSTNCHRDPVNILEEAIRGGISLFQFREKGQGALSGTQKKKLATALQQVCKEANIPFIVNDDIDLAVEIDADGVHIGQEDEAASIVRQRLGAGKWVGVSAHTIEEAERAIKDGADYLGLGPIYPTSSKDDAESVKGTAIIRQFREHGFSIPLVGIGGITSTNAAAVMEAGADGVSVISAISGSEDVEDAATRLNQAVHSGYANQ